MLHAYIHKLEFKLGHADDEISAHSLKSASGMGTSVKVPSMLSDIDSLQVS